MPDRTTINLLFAAAGVVMVGIEAWAKRTGRTRRDWTPFWIGCSILFLALALFMPGGLLRW